MTAAEEKHAVELGEKLARIRQQQRRNIPVCNRAIYDQIWESYIPHILGNPDHYETLTAALWDSIQSLRRKAAQHLPPALFRFPWESAEEWLNRCYAAGGYVHAL